VSLFQLSGLGLPACGGNFQSLVDDGVPEGILFWLEVHDRDHAKMAVMIQTRNELQIRCFRLGQILEKADQVGAAEMFCAKDMPAQRFDSGMRAVSSSRPSSLNPGHIADWWFRESYYHLDQVKEAINIASNWCFIPFRSVYPLSHWKTLWDLKYLMMHRCTRKPVILLLLTWLLENLSAGRIWELRTALEELNCTKLNSRLSDAWVNIAWTILELDDRPLVGCRGCCTTGRATKGMETNLAPACCSSACLLKRGKRNWRSEASKQLHWDPGKHAHMV
jgi:hypothetical protein